MATPTMAPIEVTAAAKGERDRGSAIPVVRAAVSAIVRVVVTHVASIPWAMPVPVGPPTTVAAIASMIAAIMDRLDVRAGVLL